LCFAAISIGVFPQTPFLLTLLWVLFCFLVWLLLYPRMITYLSINMNVASITNRIKIDMVEEINILYPDTGVWVKSLNKRSLIDPNKFKIQMSPFESGYLDSVNYKKLERVSTYISRSAIAPYFENAYQNQSL
jgi:uncharacterized membrane protein